MRIFESDKYFRKLRSMKEFRSWLTNDETDPLFAKRCLFNSLDK